MSAPETYPQLTTEQYIKGIGQTPLFKLETISKRINRNIFIKEEYLNSGTSIKDRAANRLLQDALKTGKLTPGGTIVEATAGNTGLSLALLARTYTPPFSVELFVPESLVVEKIQLLESLGVIVHKCSVVPPDHPDYFNNQAIRFAELTPDAYHVNQMDNIVNRQSHYESTGPEIYQQLKGEVHGFVASVGTGGTFCGIASFLKRQDPNVKTAIVDPQGSGLYSYVTTHGESWEPIEGGSFVEGVGKKSLTGQMHDILEITDLAFKGNDTKVIITIYELFSEGIDIGGSAGLNVNGAIELALTLPEGSNVVTTAADSSGRYASKLFNKEYLIEKGHWEKIPDHLKKFATYNSEYGN
ncbi:hypothetical protein WICPIJ_005899 [Wickerhamomyces pijperi]|uniref:Tryptophan synthase beta chain-like PALP domain-containing protein n=1 Tax=Wickerhamomyces pijperi TaxID=599730 RepID=A0A9P8Q331_WICPI|nr:hypothetical protein WICPIJ_005899 [Wickerhamomyces pijperi]